VVEYVNNGKFRPVRLPEQVQRIRFFQDLQNGMISISTDAGLVLCDVRRDSTVLISKTAQGNAIREVGRVVRDSKARVWFFTDGKGLYCVRPGSTVADYLPNPEPPLTTSNEVGNLHLIIEDLNGVVWAKPVDGNLCYVNEDDFRLHSHRECMPNGQSLPIRDYSFYFIDQQKNLWITSGSKLYQLSFGRRQFHTIFAQSKAEVRSLLADDSQHVISGDKEGRLCRYNLSNGSCQYLLPSGRWTSTPSVFNSDGIYSLYRDSRQNVWVGTRGSGLYCLKPETSKADSYAVSHYYNKGGVYDLNCNSVYDFYEDENQHLWIATFGGGLNVVEQNSDGTVRFIHAGNEMKGYPIDRLDVVRTISGDRQGHLLAGTNKGLLVFPSVFDHYTELTFRHYQAQDSTDNPLQDNMVMQVVCDKDGTFYISTYGRGLSRVVGKDFSSLSFKALPNREYPAGDTNLSAMMQSTGAVWTVASCGITCYSPRKNQMWYFDERDFDQSYTLSECTPIEMPDGKIVIGMEGGLFFFPSDDLHKSLFSPKIMFTERMYAAGSVQYQQSINDMDTLIVLPHQRSTSLRFAALDYVPSRLIRYAYWMHSSDEVQDPMWIYTVTPEVNFANLMPGEYKLYLRSTNNDGVWCNNYRILTIIVTPTIWEHWGWLLHWILVTTVAGLSLMWYLRRLGKRQRQVVKQEIASTKIEILTRPTEQNDTEFVKRLLEVLENHLSDGEMQINDLADELNMSRATFYRRLKQSFDMSPNEFIHQVRMRRSVELLTTTNDSIAQIAYAVGFNNPKYFSKCFRQDYGVTPAEYRNRARNSKETETEECE